MMERIDGNGRWGKEDGLPESTQQWEQARLQEPVTASVRVRGERSPLSPSGAKGSEEVTRRFRTALRKNGERRMAIIATYEENHPAPLKKM